MRILGVDPGSLKTGWGLLEGDVRRPRLLRSGVIRLPARGSFADRLGVLQEEFGRLVDELEPSHAAVEAPFHGKSARSALQLAHARGVIIGSLACAGVEIAEYSPATIKKNVAGNGRADKDQVRTMVAHIVDASLATAADDLTDAIAVALCHLSVGGFAEAVERAEAGARRRAVRRPAPAGPGE